MLIFCALTSPSAADNSTAAGTEETVSVTRHSIKTANGTVKYTTTAGMLTLKSTAPGRTARIFYVAYEKKGGKAEARPLTFAFNGGPGSSSVWLHLGVIGPRRVRLAADGAPLNPPPALADNEHTWLPFTDVVFIDPVGTGYSRTTDSKKEKEFFGFKSDIEAAGDFIRLYLTRHNRWMSPKFMAGESYGAARAVGLIDYLHGRHSIDLNGIVLISPVLDFNTIDFTPANDLPYPLYLPSYAAAAWYHKKLAPGTTLENALREAEAWSLGSCIAALARGDALSEEEKQAAGGTISSLCGLSRDYVAANNLRVDAWRFRKELLRHAGAVAGRMDVRMTMPDTDRAGDSAGADPSLDRLIGVFGGAINSYVRNELCFTDETPYTCLNGTTGNAWDWKSGIPGGQGYISLSRSLADAIHLNSCLMVFVAAGYYDLATPYFATAYTLNHLNLDKKLRDNITFCCYPAGHMMYTDRSCLKKLTEDVAAYYKHSRHAE